MDALIARRTQGKKLVFEEEANQNLIASGN